MPEATETSPLLGGLTKAVPEPSDRIGEGDAVTLRQSSEPVFEHNGDDIEAQGAEGSENRQTRPFDGIPEVKPQMRYLFPALSIGVFLAAADQTIIVTIYGRIGSELHALNNTSWIATAFFLTLTSFQPLFGKLSDIFGRKLCLLFAYIVFALGCLFCGLARDMTQLIIARAIAGIGGGGMTVVVSILMSDIIPLRDRGTWQGYINLTYASGAAIGAPLGGLLSDSVGWRFAFLGQTPLCLLAFCAVWWFLNVPKKAESHWKEKLRRIDFLGAVVLFSAVSTLLVAFDRGSNIAWGDRYTLIFIGVSVPSFVLFVIIEIYIAAEPMAPGHIIFERSLFAAYLCNFFSMAGWMGAIFFAPLYFQAVHGLSATQASLRLIPVIVSGVSGSLFGGFYMQRTGRYYWVTVLCYSGLVLSMTLVLVFSGLAVDSVLGIVFGMMISGFSNGTGVTTSLLALISNAGREDQAIATACSYLFRSLGNAIGVSLSATAGNEVLRKALKDSLGQGKDADKIAVKVRRSLEYIKTLEPATRNIVIDCYAKSTQAAFMVSVILVAGSAVSAWWIREKRLSK